MTCPACGDAAQLSRLFVFRDGVKRGLPPLDVKECAGCSHRFMVTDDEVQGRIEAVYEHGYAGHRPDPVFEQRVRSAIVEDISPRLSLGARVLDVGCGNGAFIRAMQEHGYKAEGIDVSASIMAALKEGGLSVRHGDFLTAVYDRPFDLISFWDVLEHLQNPSDFITRAASLLSPNGLILAKTPGFGRGAVLASGASDAVARRVLSAPNHIQYFNRRSMEALLNTQRAMSVHWFKPRGFRSAPQHGGLKKRAARLVGRLIGRYGGNTTLYFAASPDPARK